MDGCGNNVVIPLQKLLCLLRRKQLQQALHQPPRVTITNGEVFRRTSLGNGRHIHPVGNEFPQHGIDHARRPGPTVSAAHLHRLVHGGPMGYFIHKQNLIAADAQNIADHRLQSMCLLHAVAGNIVVQKGAVLHHAVGQPCSQGRLTALQPVFGNGTLEAAVGPGVSPLDLHQNLQRRVPGGKFSVLAHFSVSIGWPRR